MTTTYDLTVIHDTPEELIALIQRFGCPSSLSLGMVRWTFETDSVQRESRAIRCLNRREDWDVRAERVYTAQREETTNGSTAH